MALGRNCPLDYRYTATDLKALQPAVVDVLYVVGGLYGNGYALDAIEACAAAESQPVNIVFNGDFNWFNVDAAGFAAINERVLGFEATRGNVETELARNHDRGCGCGYPDWVDESVVDRSNAILRRLRSTAVSFPVLRKLLAALPMYRRYEVAGQRIAVVHGDPESLAGWHFSREILQSSQGIRTARRWFTQAGVDLFASSHTCTPVMARFHVDGRWAVVINNGAAGMPSIPQAGTGLFIRLASEPARAFASICGTRVGELFVDLVTVNYDQTSWLRQFEANWPRGTAAHESYHRRLCEGVDDCPVDMILR